MVMQLLACIFLGLGIPLGMVYGEITTWKWLGVGAGAWVIAVLAKFLLGWLVVSSLVDRIKGEKAKAVLWGIWSAVCELGLTAAVFLQTYPILKDVIGFGVGAGSIEILCLLIAGIAQKISKAANGGKNIEEETQAVSGSIVWSGVIERFLALFGHVCSRGLVWLGLNSLTFLPFLMFGVFLFSLIDGVATYGHSMKWDWANPRILKRFTLFSVFVGAVELAVFVAGIFLL